MTVTKVHILRVKKELVGSMSPFDKVYLFAREQEKLIPNVFTDCMVFPLTKTFAKSLWNIVDQDSVKDGEAFPMHRHKETTLAKDSKGSSPFGTLQSNYKDYVAVVPVLFVTHRDRKTQKRVMKKKKSFPMYMGGQNRSNSGAAKSALANALSAKAYFLLDAEKIRPICGACPKHFSFLQGECRPGDKSCYTYLGKTSMGQMLKNLRAYREFTKRVDEPALPEDKNVKLQTNPD